MANSLVTPTKVIKEVAAELINNIRFAKKANRSYDSQYSEGGAKVGYTVNARLPQRYKVTKGQALTTTAVDDQVVPITITDQAHVGIEFSTASLTMEIDDYKKRYIAPAVSALTNAIDYDGLQRMYQSVWMCVGQPGVVPGSTGTLPAAANLVYLNAGTKLSEGAVPVDGRVAMLSPNMHAYLSSANMTLFNPASYVSDAFQKGMFGSQALGIDEWFSTQNVATHTTGQLGGTPALASAPSEGATSLSLSGWTAAAANRLKKADVIQVAGCYSINPMNYQSTGRLQDFVVTADCDSAADGTATVSISPAMITTGVRQTVSGLPLSGALVSVYEKAAANQSDVASKASPQALVYHPDAFALVMADLEMPGGLWVAERISSKQLGISVRFLKDYDISSDQSPARLDILYGWKCIRPELACRVAS